MHTCHAAGVKVFLAYNPWDTGTRRELHTDHEVLADFIQQLDADGLFLDTMRQGGATFRTALDAAKPGVVLEAEGMPPVEHLHDHQLSWAQWFADSNAPGVLQHKWLERRHMQHQIRRWDRDHSGELQSAWMNGSGIMVWENVFGSWNGWNARDRAMLRAMLPIQRRYSSVFSQGHWTPLVETHAPNVYASLWKDRETRLWTMVNRADQIVDGTMLRVPVVDGQRYFDVPRGDELVADEREAHVLLPDPLAACGIGAYLAINGDAVNDDFTTFLREQAQFHNRTSDDTTFPERSITLRPVAPTILLAKTDVPNDMVIVESATADLTITFRTRECGMYDGAPFVNVRRPWHPELHGLVTQQRAVTFGNFAIAHNKVTNQQFARFLQATNY